MSNRKILIVEDDEKIAAAIKLYLEHNGYESLTATDGVSAIEIARNQKPDLIVLDLMLPEISGLEVCKTLRKETDLPIIMLTARSTEEDKLRGLDSGADDYITKPFSPRELMARIKAVLRRSSSATASNRSRLNFDNLTIDLERREVLLEGKPVGLTPTEFKLLETFARAPGRAFTRQELVERAFGWDYRGLDRTVDAHIMNLRKKIEPDRAQPSLIATVFGIGYKFSAKHDDS